MAENIKFKVDADVSSATQGGDKVAASFKNAEQNVSKTNDALKGSTVSGGKLGQVLNSIKLGSGLASASGVLDNIFSSLSESQQAALNFASSVKGTLVNAMTSLTASKIADAEATGTLTLVQKAYSMAVGTSTGMMKAFRIALVSTGIGALIVAVGLLINEISDYNDSLDKEANADKNAKEEKAKLNEQLQIQYDKTEKLNAAKEGGIDQLNRELKVLESSGASAEQIFKKKQEILLKEQSSLGRANESGIDKAKEYADKTNEIEVGKAEYKKKINDEAVEKAKKDNDKAIENAKIEAEKDKERLAINLQSKLDVIKDANEKERAEFDAKREAERKAAELVNADLIQFDTATAILRGQIKQKQSDEEIAKNEELNQKKLELEKKFQDDLSRIKDEEFNQTIQNLTDHFNIQRTTATENFNKGLITDNELSAQLTAIKTEELGAKLVAEKDYGKSVIDTNLEIATNSKELSENAKKIKQQEAAEDQALLENKAQAITTALNGVSSLFKEDSKMKSAIAIAQAVMDTYVGANKALASYPPPFNFIAMAGVIAGGIANVIKIKQQAGKLASEIGGSPPSGGNIPSVGPSINIAKSNVDSNTQLNASINGDKMKPTKAYVVSTEITTATSLDRKISQSATIGK
jgi:hypothetical protein